MTHVHDHDADHGAVDPNKLQVTAHMQFDPPLYSKKITIKVK